MGKSLLKKAFRSQYAKPLLVSLLHFSNIKPVTKKEIEENKRLSFLRKKASSSRHVLWPTVLLLRLYVTKKTLRKISNWYSWGNMFSLRDSPNNVLPSHYYIFVPKSRLQKKKKKKQIEENKRLSVERKKWRGKWADSHNIPIWENWYPSFLAGSTPLG